MPLSHTLDKSFNILKHIKNMSLKIILKYVIERVCVYIYIQTERERERGRTVVGELGSSRCRSRMSNYLRMITPSFIHSSSVFVLYTCHHLGTSMLIPTEDHSHRIWVQILGSHFYQVVQSPLSLTHCFHPKTKSQ